MTAVPPIEMAYATLPNICGMVPVLRRDSGRAGLGLALGPSSGWLLGSADGVGSVSEPARRGALDQGPVERVVDADEEEDDSPLDHV